MRNRTHEEEFLTPDLTPLIDVVFILLIFFLVSSVFKKEEMALLLNLPSTQALEKLSSKQENVTIEISRTQYAINGKIITKSELSNRISKIDHKQQINLRSDKTTLYHQVMEVLELLKKKNISKINLITENNTTSKAL